jgi:ADP-ribose pyrophosphatase YjhB (NUDIX family)
MRQMYKIFVNNKPLFLTNIIKKETDFRIFLLESVDIKKLISDIYNDKIQKAYLYDQDLELIINKLKSKLPIEKAGGGLVYNDKNEVLFIFRNGKWDLPKGGIEKNEKLKETAIREVEEETGIDNLEIIEKLEKTYHIFKRNGRYKLKITSWYKMKTISKKIPKPQENEGIECAKWIRQEDIPKLLNNSYENIKLLF